MTPPTRTTAQRLISNTAWNVFSLVAHAIVGFLLIRFFLGQLGPARFGVWVLIGSLLRYRGIFSMGLNSAVNRYVPRYLAQDDRAGLQRTIGTALSFYLVTAVLCLGVTALLYCFVGRWFAIDIDLIPVAQRLVAVVGIGISVVVPLQLATAVLAGLQRYDLVNGSALLVLILRTVLLVVFLRQGFGLVTMGCIFAISEIVVRLTQWRLAQRLLGDISFTGRGAEGAFLRDMLGYGINSFLYAVGAVLVLKASDFMIGASALGMEGVTQFSIAAASVLLLTQLVQAFTRALMPAVSDLQARDERDRMRCVALLAQKYSLFLILPALGFFVLLGQPFLTIWIGDRIGDPRVVKTMSVVLTLLAVGHGTRLVQHSNYLVLVGCGKHQIFGWLSAVTVVLVVVLSILVLGMGAGGLVAVAWANCLPLVLISGIILPVYFHRTMEIPWQQCLNQVWKPALCGSLPGLVTLFLWARWVPPQNWTQLLAGLVVVGSTVGGGAMLLGCTQQERQHLLLQRSPRKAIR